MPARSHGGPGLQALKSMRIESASRSRRAFWMASISVVLPAPHDPGAQHRRRVARA